MNGTGRVAARGTTDGAATATARGRDRDGAGARPGARPGARLTPWPDLPQNRRRR